MTPPQHLWFFSGESMRRMAASLGLQVERFDHPWKIVPLSLIVFQLAACSASRQPRAPAASGIGLPVNLFDAMRVVLRKPDSDSKSAAMSDRLSFAQIALLVAYAGGMAGGQLLFKMAALRAAPDGPLVERALCAPAERLFPRRNRALRARSSVLWVWMLTFTPLSRAYPFVAHRLRAHAAARRARVRRAVVAAARWSASR